MKMQVRHCIDGCGSRWPVYLFHCQVQVWDIPISWCHWGPEIEETMLRLHRAAITPADIQITIKHIQNATSSQEITLTFMYSTSRLRTGSRLRWISNYHRKNHVCRENVVLTAILPKSIYSDFLMPLKNL